MKFGYLKLGSLANLLLLGMITTKTIECIVRIEKLKNKSAKQLIILQISFVLKID